MPIVNWMCESGERAFHCRAVQFSYVYTSLQTRGGSAVHGSSVIHFY